METDQPYYISKLKEQFSLKQKSNPHYSLRAYARDLDIHPATLSQILKGNRGLPLKNSARVLSALKLDTSEKSLFLDSFIKTRSSLNSIRIEPMKDQMILNESHYKIIAEWEHYAVIELFELDHFEVTVETVAEMLGISHLRSEVVIENLLLGGLLSRDPKGSLVRQCSNIRTTEDLRNQALVDSHIESMKMGIEKIKELDVELRDFSSNTFAADVHRLPEAKAIIREFRQKMAALFNQGEKNGVFQVCIQLYPLTTVKTIKGKNA